MMRSTTATTSSVFCTRRTRRWQEQQKQQQKHQKQTSVSTKRGGSRIVSMNASTKNDGKDDEQKLTTTDSKEYYAGFLNSPLGDISVDNSSSESSNSKRRDSIAPTLKFAMNSTAVVLVLLLAFFASNGLLF
jgi:transcription initiation factor TFIID subunit TAF12